MMKLFHKSPKEKLKCPYCSLEWGDKDFMFVDNKCIFKDHSYYDYSRQMKDEILHMLVTNGYKVYSFKMDCGHLIVSVGGAEKK